MPPPDPGQFAQGFAAVTVTAPVPPAVPGQHQQGGPLQCAITTYQPGAGGHQASGPGTTISCRFCRLGRCRPSARRSPADRAPARAPGAAVCTASRGIEWRREVALMRSSRRSKFGPVGVAQSALRGVQFDLRLSVREGQAAGIGQGLLQRIVDESEQHVVVRGQSGDVAGCFLRRSRPRR